MSKRIVKTICSDCGEELEMSVREGMTAAFCYYCNEEIACIEDEPLVSSFDDLDELNEY
jgi:peptide subunit release factor 1 (eRF1)